VHAAHAPTSPHGKPLPDQNHIIRNQIRLLSFELCGLEAGVGDWRAPHPRPTWRRAAGGADRPNAARAAARHPCAGSE